MSSFSNSAKFFRANHRESQVLTMPSRKPTGCVFCPIVLLRSGPVARADRDRDVARALEQRGGPPLRARQEALQRRARADDRLGHHQVVDLDPVVGVPVVDRVGDRGLEQLLGDLRAVLRHEVEEVLRLLDVLAADQREDLVRLARRDPDVADGGSGFHFVSPSGYLPGTAAFSTCEPWPRNTRVGTNSPSLWPTMFSDT